MDPQVDLSTLSLPELRRLKELTSRQRELEEKNRILFFEPHAKQRQFFEAAGFHYRYARTGNRFGKSEMGAAEDISFALGYRPWIEEGNPLRTLGIPSHPTKGLIITTDWDKSTEVFTELEGANKGKLIRYIPSDALGKPTRNHSGAIDRVPVRHISGGWSIIHLDTVKSYKQNPLGQESSVWDWVHIDEPIPEGMWKAVSRGLVDRMGRAWFTCTPLSEPWIDGMFMPDLESQIQENAATTSMVLESRWMMTGTMDDNPHNRAEAIRLFMSQLTPEEQEARRNGLPLAYSGLVYKEFHYHLHVRHDPPPGWTSWSTPPPDCTLRFAIDYHLRKPHAVLFIATDPLERHWVYAEIWLSCLMSELVEEIKQVLQGREATVPGLIDPLAKTPNQVTDITPMDEILRLGLPVIPATKDPHNGILRVKEQLSARGPEGAPLIQFNSSLRRTLFEISRGFMFDGDTGKPAKKDDDMMENLYRLCLQGLPYIEPASTADYHIIRARDLPSLDLSPISFGDNGDTERRRRTAVRTARYRR